MLAISQKQMGNINGNFDKWLNDCVTMFQTLLCLIYPCVCPDGIHPYLRVLITPRWLAISHSGMTKGQPNSWATRV